MWTSLPVFGELVLFGVMISAAYTLAVSIVAGQGRPRWLEAARLGAYGTIAMVGLAILVLGYAFVTHDFRIRYVAHYSDRSMTPTYLLTALWGGQDGSLLWWLFLLSIYTGACVRWMHGRFRELQPWVIATLMTIMLFFCVLMAFAANPFATSVAGARLDGEGLNPLLQNFYMIIHPPALYTGFVGCAIPFAFAIAALITGRLDDEWLAACRNWMLFAWLFLSIGNALGMLWAYEELGWGGYWGWDPVENAACLPWFTASAYVHSLMVQERRGMLKVWNVVLVCLTFVLTIFGTFLTRSGLIASVHSFAQSGIGTYFLRFLALLIAAIVGLIVWRLPKLRSEGRIESIWSRDAAFLVNNWALLGIATFILVATVFPRISEWLLSQPSTVGPTFYNAWLPPVGLAVFALMGLGTVLGWRKTSVQAMRRALVLPTVAGTSLALAHIVFGGRLGMPAIYAKERIYDGAIGVVLQRIDSVLPLIASFFVAFNTVVITQEFSIGVRARMRTHGEGIASALASLVGRARHRYGGYVVHLGVVVMFVGFTGWAFNVDKETSLKPGESFRVDRYTLTYLGPRMEVDQSKRMIFADVSVVDDAGHQVGRATPAKFIYKRMPDAPTTEVSMIHSLRDDVYVVVGNVNAESKVATFQVHINPLVSWIWVGVMMLIFGAVIAMWPETALAEAGASGWLRSAGAVTSVVVFGFMLAVAPARAFAQSTSSMHAGTVQIDDPKERELFVQLLCECGDCARLPLATCTCGEADQARAEVRAKMRDGVSVDAIKADYVQRYGSGALAVPPNKGGLRAIYLVPALAALFGAGIVVFVVRKWKRKNDEGDGPPPAGGGGADVWDAKLDEELKALDG